VELEDTSFPYFVAGYILKTLLQNSGCIGDIANHPFLLKAIGAENHKYRYLLSDILGCKVKSVY